PSGVRPPDRPCRALGPGVRGQGERDRAQGLPRRGLTEAPMDGPARPDVPAEDPRHPRVFTPARRTTDRPPVLRRAARGPRVRLVVVAKPWEVLVTRGQGDGDAASPAEVADAGSGSFAAPPPPATAVPTPSPSLRDDTAGSAIAAFCLDPN